MTLMVVTMGVHTIIMGIICIHKNTSISIIITESLVQETIYP